MMKQILWIFIAFCLIASGPASGLARSGADNPSTPPTLQMIHSDENGIILELSTPNYEIISRGMPAGDFDEIILPETDSTSEPGKPQIPFVSALIGIPPNAELKLRVLSQENKTLGDRYHLIPAPSLAPSVEEFSPGDLVYALDESAYAADGFYPAEPAQVTSEAWLRDQRIARIELHPFQYNPAQGSLLWNQQIRVEVSFIYDSPLAEAQASSAKPAQESAFAPVLEASLLNYETAKNWQGLQGDQADRMVAQFDQTQSLGPRYRIAVDQDGLYEIAYADLAGIMADIDTVNPQNFQFSSQGADVDIVILGEEDGSFDPGDKIIFYGQKFYGDRHAARYADENAYWNTYSQQQTDGSYLPWKPQYNATMVEKYTDENVYWLIVGTSPGSRMSTVNGDISGNMDTPEPYFRATVHAEENMRWKTDLFLTEDTWFWERIFQPTSQKNFTTTLTAIATEPFSVTLRAQILARDNNPHHTYLYFNGDLVDDRSWTGISSFTLEKEISQSVLVDGVNALEFDADLIDNDHQFYINWFEIDYNRLFEAEGNQLWFSQPAAGAHKYEITDFTDTSDLIILDVTTPLTPTHILSPTINTGTGTVTISATNTVTTSYFIASSAATLSPADISYYQPPDLYAATNEVEYVIITHADFVTVTQTLANHRAAQGLTTMVIDAQDLYNEFNDGIYNPIAIKNFLAHALGNWQKAPKYALLIGDGNWNFKAYNTATYGDPGIIYMPPNLAWVDPAQGEVDSTNLLATIVGSDPLPDIHIARLPVSSTTELNAYTTKLIAYDAAPTNQSWQRRMLFLADNYDPGAGDFDATADRIINNYMFPSIYQVDRIYQDDYGCTSASGTPTQCTAVKNAIIDTLNITGTLIMSYHGHGGTQWWSHEKIFTVESISSLTNGNRLPVMLSLDCLDGYWYFPPNAPSGFAVSLVEEMVNAANKGAIAAFSPGGLGLATGHEILHNGFMESLMDHNIWEMGPAALNAKLKLYNANVYLDLLQTFTIFGDPALQIPGGNYNIDLPIVQK